MLNNDRYYEPEDDDENEKVDERVAELMKEDYKPTDFNNFIESISEASKKDVETIEDYLEQGEFEKLGRKLWSICYERMEAQANSHAVENLMSGYLD
jgi:hypothetical protein